eukprot:RCo031536
MIADLNRFVDHVLSSQVVILTEFTLSYSVLAIDAISDFIVAVNFLIKKPIPWGVACFSVLLTTNIICFLMVWCNRARMQKPSPWLKAIPFIPIYELAAMLPHAQLAFEPREVRLARMTGERAVITTIEFMWALTECVPQLSLQIALYIFVGHTSSTTLVLISLGASALSILKTCLKYLYMRCTGATKFGTGLFMVGRSTECSTNPFFALTQTQPSQFEGKALGDEG